MKKRKLQGFGQLMQIALYLVLLCGVLFLAYSGSRLYQSVSVSKQNNEVQRGTLAYLQSQVSANDSAVISIETIESGSLLRLPLGESGYDMMIYCADGSLVEETAKSGSAPSPDKAQTIADSTSFSAAWVNPNLLRLEVDGKTALVSLRTEEATQ